MAPTTHERRKVLARAQAAQRQREREAGLVRRTVTIPAHRAEELADIVRRWRDEDDAEKNRRGCFPPAP